MYRAYPGRDVIRHIAAAEGREYATVRRWVAEARAGGYLEPTTPGQRSRTGDHAEAEAGHAMSPKRSPCPR